MAVPKQHATAGKSWVVAVIALVVSIYRVYAPTTPEFLNDAGWFLLFLYSAADQVAWWLKKRVSPVADPPHARENRSAGAPTLSRESNGKVRPAMRSHASWSLARSFGSRRTVFVPLGPRLLRTGGAE